MASSALPCRGPGIRFLASYCRLLSTTDTGICSPRHSTFHHYPTTTITTTTTTIHPHLRSFHHSQWNSREARSPRTKGYSSTGTSTPKVEQKWQAWKRRSGQFQTHFDNYQMFWNNTSSQDMSQFSHPSVVDVTWDQIQASEEAYANLCLACHERLVGLGSFWTFANSEKVEEDDTDSNTSQKPQAVANSRVVVYPSSHDKMDTEIVVFYRQILYFWERIRSERTALVLARQPKGYPHDKQQQKQPPPQPVDEGKGSFSIGKWFKQFTSRDTPNDESKQKDYPLVLAHNSPKYAPNQYHYTRLIGRLFFQYPNADLQPETWYLSRAKDIQEVVDQAPNPDLLSPKSLRLLVRAYGDVGTCEESKKAEDKVYRKFHGAQKHLFRYVVSNYWHITQRAKSLTENKDSDPSEVDRALQEAAEATNRVVALLLQPKLDHKLRQRFLPIGLHCLANIPPHVVHNYYDSVEAVTKRMFGRYVAQQLLSSAGPSSKNAKPSQILLSIQDRATIQTLVQIYSQPHSVQQPDSQQIPVMAESMGDPVICNPYLPHAKRLMDLLFETSTVKLLDDILSRDTFHSILKGMILWNHASRSTTERDENFQFAMKLLRWMVLAKPWWPTPETWEYLFTLARTGEQSDEVWRKHELCSMLSDEPQLSPLATTKRVLKAWFTSSKRGLHAAEDASGSTPDALPVRRAWCMFYSLYTSSTPPYFFASEPHLVNHLYNHNNAPDHIVYMSVWQICSDFGAWDTAHKVYEMAQEQKRRGDLNFLAGATTAFLRCLPFCPDEEQRRTLAQQVYEEVIENDEVIQPTFLAALKNVHPDLYQTYQNQLQDN